MILFDKTTKQIQINRGDSTTFVVSAKDNDGNIHTFQMGDILKFTITERKNESNVVFQKEVEVTEASTTVNISLTSEDTKIGEIISKPVVYWYEISVTTPGGSTQTIIGYDDEGAKELVLNPEADEVGGE